MKSWDCALKTLHPDDKYSCYRRKMFLQVRQMQLYKNPKIFYQFFIAFLESTSYFEHFEKTISLRAQIFPKLLTPKYLVT